MLESGIASSKWPDPGDWRQQTSTFDVMNNSLKKLIGCSRFTAACLFHIKNLHVRPITLPIYDEFEYLSVYVNDSGINSLVIVLYRPGSANVSDKFFESFTDLLERKASYKSNIIAGDTNIHLDNLTDHHTIKVNCKLTTFELTQHVT